MTDKNESVVGEEQNVPNKMKCLRNRLQRCVEDLKEMRDVGKQAERQAAERLTFKGMYLHAEKLFEQAFTLYNDMEELETSVGVTYLTSNDRLLRSSAKRFYYEINSLHESLKPSSSPGTSYSIGSAVVSGRLSRLPVIDIPTFSGNVLKWPEFRGTYVSLVHESNELTKIEKFHYLKAALKGPASAVVVNLPLLEDHYDSAWQTVLDTYDSNRMLATTYLNSMLDMKALPSRASASALRSHTAHMKELIDALQALAIPHEGEFVLFHLLYKTLDIQTRESFENYFRHNQSQLTYPSHTHLLKWLKDRANASQIASGVQGDPSPGPSRLGKSALFVSTRSSSPQGRGDKKSVTQNRPEVCFICRNNHHLPACPQFLSETPAGRLNLLRRFKGCRNCLYPGHITKSCHSRINCKYCRGRHHTLLHLESNKPVQSPASKSEGSSELNSVKPTVLTSHPPHRTQAILGTALVRVAKPDGPFNLANLAVDSGSHLTFITRSLAERCGMTIQPSNISILGIGEANIRSSIVGHTKVLVSPRDSGDPVFPITATVIETITAPQPQVQLSKNDYEPYLRFNLADPEFWRPKTVEILLGCEVFPDILTGKVQVLDIHMPRLVGTVFGDMVMGRLDEVHQIQHYASLLARNSEPSPETKLLQQVEKFWELEEVPMAPFNHPSEEHFKQTVKRLPCGRYVVRLPFKDTPPSFQGHQQIALKRLLSLERRFERDPELKRLYQGFMKEYLELGHMNLAHQPARYLIPHQGVLKGDSPNKKIRVVFDAASKTPEGSLNDWLEVGPNLQNNITTILLNFRRHAVVFTADAEKMYRQIVVDPLDRPYQHILWRDSPSCQLQEYELATVTYGMTCGPYLALRVVRQLCHDEKNNFPEAAAALQTDMYMDDLATGKDTVEEAILLKEQAINLMERGGFSLRKWASNHPALLDSEHSPNQDSAVISWPPSAGIPVSILGLRWDPAKDHFTYCTAPPNNNITKRGILSSVAHIYDPLGILGPVVIVAKGIIQDTWKCQLTWDAPLPPHLCTKWQGFIQGLSDLPLITVPRHLGISRKTKNITYLIFADASEFAYCATVYLRLSTLEGPKCTLLVSKTKLAPIKSQTVPRLELCAALLAAKLWDSLTPFRQHWPDTYEAFFFSDSMVVLSWIQTPLYQLKTFVANRVAKITELTSSFRWYHVTSEDNPSDIGSRGTTPALLKDNKLWFQGPPWALLLQESWPLISSKLASELPELKSSSAVLTACSENDSILTWCSRISSFSKLQRSFAWALRFISNCKSKLVTITRGQAKHTLRPLSLDEIHASTNFLIRLSQAEQFFGGQLASKEIQPSIPASLRSLAPRFSPSWVLTVGGRLTHSPLLEQSKHPIILHAKSHLGKSLILHYHKLFLHLGPRALLAQLRTRYWLISGNSVVKQIFRNCVKCRQLKAQACPPMMGDLPKCRFAEGRAFLHVGIDLGGPFVIRESLRRKAPTHKCYLVLFVCLSSKAVHLDVVTSLSTEGFIAALDRFISRRGRPLQIFSDNGTNFAGSANILKEWRKYAKQNQFQQNMINYGTLHEIDWHFIPPTSPHFGGIWEAAIKSAKGLIKTVYGENIMTLEEILTLFHKVEAMLNSRPLCPLSNDPNDDADYLSPGHFLIGSPLTSYPEPCKLDLKSNYLSRWQLVQQKSQQIWKRWRLEYLSQLQQRTKWTKPQPNLSVGDLVLLKEDRVDRLQWPRGRIQGVHPGKDGVIRVADVKTPNGLYRRPVHHLILLLPSNSYQS